MWISTKQKNGFSYDHALASIEFNEKIKEVRYDNQVRLEGVSDHSMLIIEAME